MNRRILVLGIVWLCAFLGCMGCLSSVRQATTPSAQRSLVINRALNSTIAIVRENPESHQLTPGCTGVFINRSQILTAAHCVQRTRTEEVIIGPFVMQRRAVLSESPVGDVYKMISYEDYNNDNVDLNHVRTVEVVAYDRTRDLALLQVPESDLNFNHDFLAIASGDARVGMSVCAIGHPAGIWFNFTQGIVTGRLMRQGNKVMLRTSAQVYFGNSGGPVINDQGEIMGITSALSNDQSYLHFAVYVSSIRAFLVNFRNGTPYLDLPASMPASAPMSMEHS